VSNANDEERSESREFCERSEQNLERRAQASLSAVETVEGFLHRYRFLRSHSHTFLGGVAGFYSMATYKSV